MPNPAIQQFDKLFLFVTEECQLRCKHCYMGNRLLNGATLDFFQAKKIVEHFYKLGTRNLVLVGGEPTLYPFLKILIDYVHQLGYKKVILDSNGFSMSEIITNNPHDLDYVRVSLDGATPKTHEKIRGHGNFARTIFGIQQLIDRGFSVWITSTIFSFNYHELEELLALADNLGIQGINFHVFSAVGNGVNHKDWSINPYEWILCCENLNVLASKFKVKIIYPPTWVKKTDIGLMVQRGYEGCQGILLNQISVFPDGSCYLCPLFVDSKNNFSFFTEEGGLVINKNENEYELFLNYFIRSEIDKSYSCPADSILGITNDSTQHCDLVSLCRLWRTEAGWKR